MMQLIPLSERKTDAEGNKQTGSNRLIEGIHFYVWNLGIGRYESRSADQRIILRSNFRKSGYHVAIDGEWMEKTFRYERTAVQAVLKKLSAK